MIDLPHDQRRASDRLLKIEEAAAVLRRSHWTLRQDIKAGRIEAFRLGRRILIRQSELDRVVSKGWRLKT
jgi:excisionase family DNA binding protein